ncbi:hypothetical protein H2199_002464 [Coniosporium tulheliwenetii]|uniref:Uncharacterized protein n=1 Tax=Coniosporium tulheliwenetii TaxID=3383036 RepID=A0ACC2ZGS3_9PEZI|nr:hypothetical protein H2199_002464 [Cladosporium sp. JES 115]
MVQRGIIVRAPNVYFGSVVKEKLRDLSTTVKGCPLKSSHITIYVGVRVYAMLKEISHNFLSLFSSGAQESLLFSEVICLRTKTEERQLAQDHLRNDIGRLCCDSPWLGEPKNRGHLRIWSIGFFSGAEVTTASYGLSGSGRKILSSQKPRMSEGVVRRWALIRVSSQKLSQKIHPSCPNLADKWAVGK